MENNTDNQLPSILEQSADRKLTAAELKAYPGCEHYSDEEAENITTTLYRLAVFLINVNGASESIDDNNPSHLK